MGKKFKKPIEDSELVWENQSPDQTKLRFLRKKPWS